MKETLQSRYEAEKLSYRNILDGNMQPWVMRFIKDVGRGVNDFDMIRDGERILLGVSGGKDSLALSLALSMRKRWLPIDYELSAVMIDWVEHPIEASLKPRLEEFFKDLDINFEIVSRNQFPSGDIKEDYNCYICSRNRRKILFEIAHKRGFRQIALGHHLDDFVETSMMNLYFRGKLEPMNPVQEFFDGQLYIIRPMIEVHENTTRRLSQIYDLPVTKPVCPYDQKNIRAELKPIVKQLCHMDRYAREHVLQAYDLSTRIKR